MSNFGLTISKNQTFVKKPFWLSVKKTSACLFSRRAGKKGTRIMGFSICLRIFGVEVL